VLAAAEDPLQLISITGPPGIGALARRTMIVYGMAHAMVQQSGDNNRRAGTLHTWQALGRPHRSRTP